jgi:hypothetical protein
MAHGAQLFSLPNVRVSNERPGVRLPVPEFDMMSRFSRFLGMVGSFHNYQPFKLASIKQPKKV